MKSEEKLTKFQLDHGILESICSEDDPISLSKDIWKTTSVKFPIVVTRTTLPSQKMDVLILSTRTLSPDTVAAWLMLWEEVAFADE